MNAVLDPRIDGGAREFADHEIYWRLRPGFCASDRSLPWPRHHVRNLSEMAGVLPCDCELCGMSIARSGAVHRPSFQLDLFPALKPYPHPLLQCRQVAIAGFDVCQARSVAV